MADLKFIKGPPEKYTTKSLQQLIPCNGNTKVVMVNEETLEPYTSPIICWGIVNTITMTGDILDTSVIGYMIGQSSSLIPVIDDDTFVGYIVDGEDSSALAGNIKEQIKAIKAKQDGE